MGTPQPSFRRETLPASKAPAAAIRSRLRVSDADLLVRVVAHPIGGVDVQHDHHLPLLILKAVPGKDGLRNGRTAAVNAAIAVNVEWPIKLNEVIDDFPTFFFFF